MGSRRCIEIGQRCYRPPPKAPALAAAESLCDVELSSAAKIEAAIEAPIQKAAAESLRDVEISSAAKIEASIEASLQKNVGMTDLELSKALGPEPIFAGSPRELVAIEMEMVWQALEREPGKIISGATHPKAIDDINKLVAT